MQRRRHEIEQYKDQRMQRIAMEKLKQKKAKSAKEREERLKVRNQNKIYQFGDTKLLLFWQELPLEGIDKVLFQTYVAWCRNKGKIEPLDFYKSTYGQQYKPLNFPNDQMSFCEFSFLRKIDNGFININSICLSTYMYAPLYKYVKYKFDKVFLRNIINYYICDNDKESCVIMGGYFSKYNEDNFISKKFPWLFQQIKKKGDIDIYLFNANSSHYIIKFMIMGLEIISRNLDSDYESVFPSRFNTLKIRPNYAFCPIINLIFLKQKEHICNNTKCIFFNAVENCLDMINSFDLDICKILYSYTYDSIFVKATLFSKYNKISLKCKSKVAPLDLAIYKDFFSGDAIFLAKTLHSMRDAFTPAKYTKMIRYLKYSFKGYYMDEKEADSHIIIIQKINDMLLAFPSILD